MGENAKGEVELRQREREVMARRRLGCSSGWTEEMGDGTEERTGAQTKKNDRGGVCWKGQKKKKRKKKRMRGPTGQNAGFFLKKKVTLSPDLWANSHVSSRRPNHVKICTEPLMKQLISKHVVRKN